MARKSRAQPKHVSAVPQAAAVADMGGVWLDSFEEGARAWTAACTDMTQACLAVGEAQARVGQELFSLWMRSCTPFASLEAFGGLLRDELFLAEAAGEKFADAARVTMRDVAVKGGPAAGPTALPE